MKFFKKQGVAITVLVLAIIGAIVLGQVRKPASAEYDAGSKTTASAWADEHYSEYTKYVEDDADLLSADTETRIAKYNAQLDYTYGSIMAVRQRRADPPERSAHAGQSVLGL